MVFLNLFSLNLWKNCKFNSNYSVSTTAEGNKAFVTIQAKEFAKSVFISLTNNYQYTYSDNYIDLEAGTAQTIVITSNKAIDVSQICVTDFAKAGS